MAERRPTSTPVSEQRGMAPAATVAAPAAAAPVQGSAELRAALSRRFRIVEGGTPTAGSASLPGMRPFASGPSGGGGACAVMGGCASEGQAQAPECYDGPAACRSSGGAPGPGALRMMQGHARTHSSPGTAAPGAPPPPAKAGSAGSLGPTFGTTRYPIVQPATPTSRSPTAASTAAHTHWTQLSADRIRKYTWPRSEQPPASAPTSVGAASGSCTPTMPPVAVGGVATDSALTSPRTHIGASRGCSEILIAAQQRFGRFSAPPPTVSWRSVRDSSDQVVAMDMLSARPHYANAFACEASEADRDAAVYMDFASDEKLARASEAERDVAVYMDWARDEKKARDEAVAAQRAAEARAEEAMLAQQAAEQHSAEQARQAEQLRARNDALESRLLALERSSWPSGSPGTATPPAADVARLKSDKAALEREVAQLRGQLKGTALEVAEKIGDTLHRSNTELEVYRNQMKEEVAMRGRMDAEMAVIRSEKRKLADELQHYKRNYNEVLLSSGGLEEELSDLRDQNELYMREAQQAAKEREELREYNRRLLQQVQDAEASRHAGDASPALGAAPGSSESRLRSALAGGASTADLGEAIASVEALLGEAKRELKTQQLRERRAAYEALHKAERSDDEATLARAIAEARRTHVDREEIETAEGLLEKLRAMTKEERAARDAAKLRAKRKEQAFLHVKRDECEALGALLEAADEDEASLPASARGQRWPEWKDHAGRTLLRASVELRSKAAQETLRRLIEAREAPSPTWTVPPASPERCPVPKAEEQKIRGAAAGGTPASASPPLLPRFGAGWEVRKAPRPAPETTPEAPTPTPSVEAPEPSKDEEELRTKAFRAVVKDDTASLAAVIIDRVPTSTWSAWKNKAGKDLLTLSEERGSSAAYSLLAKALGLLKERKRESFEEREAVWVLFTGEVQPRRATVLEDTPADADEILLEFWDGNDAASHIDRSFVLKACC